MLWPPYVIGGHYIFALWFLLSSSSFLFPRLISAVVVWPYANLECRPEMCCTRLAGNADPKNSPKNRHLGTIAHLCPAISSQLRHVSTIGKNLLSSSICSTCPHNTVNFGPLANFNGFRLSSLGSVIAQHSSIGPQPNFAALNRGRHLYSAGRPSRSTLAHILV